MTEQLVTVVIPVYNVEKYLARCLDTVLAQSYQNIQIILVNDGSTDGSREICQSYAQKDSRILVVHQENGGLSAARNAGIKRAAGDYITFIDSDDYVEAQYVETLYRCLKKYDSDLSIGAHTTIYPHTSYVHAYERECCMKPEQVLCKLLYDQGIDTTACAKLYKRELFQNVEFPKGRLFEDAATTYRLIDGAKSISVTPVSVYNYEIRSNSISRETFSERKLDLIKSTQEMTGYIRERYPQLAKGCNRRLMHAYLSTLSQLASSDEGNPACQKLLMDYIQAHRREVLKDPDIPKRDRAALYITRFGFGAYRLFWRLYLRVRGSVQ